MVDAFFEKKPSKWRKCRRGFLWTMSMCSGFSSSGNGMFLPSKVLSHSQSLLLMETGVAEISSMVNNTPLRSLNERDRAAWHWYTRPTSLMRVIGDGGDRCRGVNG